MGKIKRENISLFILFRVWWEKVHSFETKKDGRKIVKKRKGESYRHHGNSVNNRGKQSLPVIPNEVAATTIVEQPVSASSGMEVAKREKMPLSGLEFSVEPDRKEVVESTEAMASEPDLPYAEEKLSVKTKTPFTPQLPTLPLRALIVEAKYSEIPPYAPRPSLKSKGARERSVVLMAGALSWVLGYDSPGQSEEPQASLQLRLGYERLLNGRWSVATGLEVHQYRFRTAFENVEDNVLIYQPGTIDTIFRNFTTGEERISTTDTVAGTRIRRFGNDNTVTTLEIPVLIRRYWPLGGHRFSLAAGPRVGIVLSREGKTVIGDYEVARLVESAPQFVQNLLLANPASIVDIILSYPS